MKTPYISGILLALFLFTGNAQAQVYDNFDASTLDPVWSWVREYQPYWSLTDGCMEITTARGALNTTKFNNVQNILLQNALDDDIIRMETKLLFSPVYHLHNAGLVYYLDDDNYIRVSRGIYPHDDGHVYNGVWMEWETEGETHFHFVDKVTSDTTWLRLSRTQDTLFLATYSLNGYEWYEIGKENITFSGPAPKTGLQAANGEGLGAMGDDIPARFDYFGMDPTGITTNEILPAHLAIETVYPNPLTSTEIAVVSFRLARTGDVSWHLTDVLGRRLSAPKVRGRLQPGLHNITFSLRDVPTGVYFLHLSAGNTRVVQRILLTR